MGGEWSRPTTVSAEPAQGSREAAVFADAAVLPLGLPASFFAARRMNLFC